MVLEGHAEFANEIHESDKLSASERGFLHAQWKQFRSWWGSWEGKS
jgi:hypothetical protein